MGKQIAELYAVISGDTSKLEASLKSSKAGLTKMKDTLGETVQQVTGFNLAQIGLAAGIGAAVGAAKKAITEYSNYAESVDKMSMATGMTAEETSRLIQAADDFRVSQESLEMGMKMMLQNGITPSIGGLAKLSDKYLSIQDPAKRAGEMQKIFGRSWQEMVPFLERGGKAIQEAAAGISDNLVVTKQGIDTNRQFAKVLDDLGDAWTGVQYAFAKNNLPAITGSLQIFAKNLEDLDKGRSLFSILAENQQSYATLDAIIRDTTDVTYDWSDAQREGMHAAKTFNDALPATSEALEAVAASMQKAGGQLDLFTTRLGDTGGRWRQYNEDAAKYSDLSTAAANTEAFNRSLERQADLMGELQGASATLADAQANFNKTYGGEAKSSLDKYGVSGQKLVDAYGAMDEKLGTTYKAQYENEKKMNDLALAYARGKISAKEYADGLEAQKGSWSDLDDNLKNAKLGFENAQTAWNNFIQSIGAANGQHFSVTVDVNTNYSGGGGKVNTRAGTSYVSKDEPGPGRAIGGAVYAGQTYTVGEQGWESFVPAANGFMISHQEAVDILRGNRSPVTTTEASQVNVIDKARPYNLYFTSTKSDAREVAREVVRLMINRS